MKKIYNERHTHMEQMPSKLDVLRELEKRVPLDAELTQKLNRAASKEKGLQRVLQLIERYGKDHWLYVTDVAMDYHSIINCDLLVMTTSHVYTLEINEYEGTFELKDKVSSLDGEILEEHPIAMAQSVLTQLQSFKLLAPVPIDLKLKGAALFTNPANEIEIHDDVKDIDIVAANQIEKFVKQMVKDEKRARAKGATFNPLYLSWVVRIDRHHPYIPLDIPDAIMENIRPGVLCSHCGSFDVHIGEVLMKCECGGWESVEDAITRTVWDYSTLMNGEDLHIPSLIEFFNDQIPKHQLEDWLDHLFATIN